MNELHTFCLLWISCYWIYRDSSVHWTQLSDIWQQRYPQKVQYSTYSLLYLKCNRCTSAQMETVDCCLKFRSVFRYKYVHKYVFLCSCRLSGSRTNIFMRFKSTSEDGLLLWRGDSPMRANSEFMSLGLQDGALIFRCEVKNRSHMFLVMRWSDMSSFSLQL